MTVGYGVYRVELTWLVVVAPVSSPFSRTETGRALNLFLATQMIQPPWIEKYRALHLASIEGRAKGIRTTHGSVAGLFFNLAYGVLFLQAQHPGGMPEGRHPYLNLPVMALVSGPLSPPPLRCRALRKQQGRRNRLSRYQYVPDDPSATLASEEILMTTGVKETTIHTGGWVGFKPSNRNDNVGDRERHAMEKDVGRGGAVVGCISFCPSCARTYCCCRYRTFQPALPPSHLLIPGKPAVGEFGRQVLSFASELVSDAPTTCS